MDLWRFELDQPKQRAFKFREWAKRGLHTELSEWWSWAVDRKVHADYMNQNRISKTKRNIFGVWRAWTSGSWNSKFLSRTWNLTKMGTYSSFLVQMREWSESEFLFHAHRAHPDGKIDPIQVVEGDMVTFLDVIDTCNSCITCLVCTLLNHSSADLEFARHSFMSCIMQATVCNELLMLPRCKQVT